MTSRTARTVGGVDRRSFLAGAAAGALLAAPRPVRAAPARVVVVGGGWGGLGAVRALAGRPGIELVLLEPNPAFVSCPLSIHYIVGERPFSDFEHGYATIDALGVRRIREAAVAIDRDRREVATASARIPYDFLVLSPGVEYVEEAIAGFAQARDRLPVGFRPFEQHAVKALVDRFLSEGGTFAIAVPKPPYRCPPAPYERACLVAEQIKKRGTKGKVVVADANPRPLPPPIAEPILEAMRTTYAGLVEYLPDHEVKAVNFEKGALDCGVVDVPFTHANIVPPMRAPRLLREAGLGERWAAVRLPDFRAQGDERIWIVGDAAGTPLPKSGHVAFNAGAVAARAILRRIAGEPEPAAAPTELPAGICFAAVTRDRAIMIAVESSFVPGEGAKSRFHVDPAPTRESSEAAMNWGRSMWQSMLG
ncbi:MAG: FAD/NAD(P)-binding oxidoreductase [Geminicoccaceae bacterium]|nr:NAD(P)/FAD-dependent oxidoreductase [Geminicoccaceae bacterium]MDW8124565.1 FAD/NAD(P)-binding oxidoreductase [Geminicoccaceae bacterium]